MNQTKPPVIPGTSKYYDYLKELAHTVRNNYRLTTNSISLSSLRSLYKQEDIQLDYWHFKLRKVRGAYLVLDDRPYVLINAAIQPKEPRIFIMAHELKHHLVDFELAKSGALGCQFLSWSEGSPIEIGAEIFASELIYPESECVDLVNKLGITSSCCTPELVVILKRQSPAPVSYKFLVKRLERFQIITKNQFATVKFQKLEEQMHGLPNYLRRRRTR